MNPAVAAEPQNPADEFEQQAQAAIVELETSIARADLGRDAYRYPLTALASTMRVLVAHDRRMRETVAGCVSKQDLADALRGARRDQPPPITWDGLPSLLAPEQQRKERRKTGIAFVLLAIAALATGYTIRASLPMCPENQIRTASGQRYCPVDLPKVQATR